MDRRRHDPHVRQLVTNKLAYDRFTGQGTWHKDYTVSRGSNTIAKMAETVDCYLHSAASTASSVPRKPPD